MFNLNHLFFILNSWYVPHSIELSHSGFVGSHDNRKNRIAGKAH